jgi:geranylgeranyl pyrophosphate synthase
MASEKKIMEKALMILQEMGSAAVELAKNTILQEQVQHAPLREALHYFIEDWNDILHPALVSLACEAVGGKASETRKAGAALVLLAGGADIHDDVIDESTVKGTEQTVFGKFGKDLAVLAGDVLLLKGVYLLHEACEMLGETRKKTILDFVKQTFFEISSAEAEEANMRGRTDIKKQQYLDIIRQKVAAGEAATRIGALIGEGTTEEVETLAEYGRAYGVLMSIRDEFVDVFEQDELSNRVKREVLPLPIMVTLADASKKPALIQLISGKITDIEIEKIVDLVTNSKESMLLVSDMRQIVDRIVLRTKDLRYCRENLDLMATATLEDL